GKRDQLDRSLLPRLESHRGSRGDVETKSSRRGTIERQRSVGFREVIMRADLDRPVAGVCNRQADRGPAGIELDLSILCEDFAGNHGIGWCTVTSLVPSGNVASTWISGIISGMPSITWSRARSVAPWLIKSATVRPSRAPSMIAALMNATASG